MGHVFREPRRSAGASAARLTLALLLAVMLAPALHAQAGDAPDASGDPAPANPVSPARAAQQAREAEFKAYRTGLADAWPGELKSIERKKTSLERAEKLYRSRRKRSKSKGAPKGIALKARMKSLRQVAAIEVELGLAWLAAHQSPGGFWSCAAFDTECGRLETNTVCSGTGSPQFDVGVTALALLGFLRAGHTPQEGRYAPTVRAGLDYLVAVQTKNGMLGAETNSQSTYDHVIATLALVEAVAATGSSQYKAAAQKGLAKMFSMRNPGATWRYQPFHSVMKQNPNDTSVTGWAVQSMAMARELDMDVDRDAWIDSLTFIVDMTDTSTGRTGYTDRGARPAREVGKDKDWPADQSESMTAIGLLCRQLIAPTATDRDEKKLREQQAGMISRLSPVWDRPARIDYYFWYQGSLALALYGGDDAYWWADHLIEVAFAHEHEDKDAVGSWDPHRGPWGSVGGRVYSTSLMTLSMQAIIDSD